MKINITTTDTTISVETPYSADFVKRCRQLSGKWDASAKVWRFQIALKADVLQALNDCYGYVADSRQERVTLKVTVHDDLIADCSPVKFGPYELAKAWGRDSGAKPGQNVALISGRIRSGGSRKNWDSRVAAGAVFKLLDVPLSVAERLREIACKETFSVYERVDNVERVLDGEPDNWGDVYPSNLDELKAQKLSFERAEDKKHYFLTRRIEKQIFTVEEV